MNRILLVTIFALVAASSTTTAFTTPAIQRTANVASWAVFAEGDKTTTSSKDNNDGDDVPEAIAQGPEEGQIPAADNAQRGGKIEAGQVPGNSKEN